MKGGSGPDEAPVEEEAAEDEEEGRQEEDVQPGAEPGLGVVEAGPGVVVVVVVGDPAVEGGFGARAVLLALGFGVEDEADDEAAKIS